MHVLALRIELHFPQPQSLKQKRGLLKPVVEGIRNRYNAAVSEVGFQDQWQRATIGIAVVSSTPAHAEQMLDEIERFVWSFPDLTVLNAERNWMEFD